MATSDFYTPEYYARLVILFVGFCVAAFVTLLYLFCFYLCRCCCGSKMCPQCCQNCAHCLCGGKPKESYSDFYKRFFFFGSITLALVVFIFVVIGLSGNGQVSKGVENLTGDVIGVVSDIYNKTDYAYSQTKNLNTTQSLADEFKTLRDSAGEVRDEGNDFRAVILHFDGIRRGIMGVGFALPLFGIFFAVIGLIIGKKGFQYLLVFFVGIAIIFFWLSLAVHVPVKRVSTDACSAFDDILANPEQLGDGFGFIVSCIQNGTYFAPLQGTLNQVQSAMTKLKQDAANQGFNISDVLPVNGSTIEDQVTSIANFVSAQLADLSNDIGSKPDSPALEDLKQQIDTTRAYINIAVDLSTLARCDYLLGLLKKLRGDFCDEAIGGAGLIVTANSALIPLSILAAYFVLALFLIRFPAEARAYYDLDVTPAPSPVGLVVVTTQVSGQPMGQPYSAQAIAAPSSGSISGIGTTGGGGGGTGTTTYEPSTDGSPVMAQPQGIQMACFQCNTLFAVAPGTPSGTVVACPTCQTHNQLP